MTSPILVTGGTGTLGSHVVPLLREAGRDVRILSRHPKESSPGIEHVSVDLLKGEGIEPALKDVEILLHLAGGPKGDDKATAHLMAAAKNSGVKHVVYISVIGADRVPVAWLKQQHGAEQAIIDSGLPWTILRAAQFNDLILTVVEKMTKMPVVPCPGGLRFQPVDSREVAARLADLTLGTPQGMVRALAGPKVYGMRELATSYLQARGKKRPMMGMRMPGKAGKAYRAGENLALEGNDVGKRTWEEFLAERVS
ncbi:SDR family oxidoreductase [Streptomyces physcomitrii]|uniref:NAD(P)H-binding protein n=1 Tax=Streptomyces physcomitrii TaxID=2724184 RepID=A0ABX1GXV5_9ACTN|nr:NAD(P)H-binding protein [Streptomyces physcomitrii]NKI40926.1 NAD(P)H-binding protein [Streptomyces physcomitrii]